MKKTAWWLAGLSAIILSLAASWYLWGLFIRYHANTTEECLKKLHTDPILCRRAGGLLDMENKSTVCVFTCTTPP